MLATGSLKAALDGKVIKIYSGTAPDTADAALNSDNTLLCTVSVNDTGTGVALDSTASSGQISKSSNEVWSGTIATSGTASFFRMETSADDNSASTTAVRLQGTVGNTDADMIFGTLALVAGNVRQINYFTASVSAG
ncbi:hypothetical protein HAQ04_25535 [Pseudomonas sp. C2L11]|nr:hypothetical protein [Pseudomonas typographi]